MKLLKKIVSNVWAWVGFVLTVMTLALGVERSRRKRAELKLLDKDTAVKDALIEKDKLHVQEAIKKEQQHQKELQQRADKQREVALTNKEIEEWWKKN